MNGLSHDNYKYRKKFGSFQSVNYSDNDFHTVIDNEDEIIRKSLKGALKEHVESVVLLISMVKDIFDHKYKEILPYTQ